MSGKTKAEAPEQTSPISPQVQRQQGGQEQTKAPVPASADKAMMGGSADGGGMPDGGRTGLMRQVQRQGSERRVSRGLRRSAQDAPNPGQETRTALEQSGRGQPLPPVTRQGMERSFGADLSNVRVHTDAQADKANRELNANAFASGQDVYFGQGKFQPETPQGKHLIAHELAHTLQQKEAPISRKTMERENDGEKAISSPEKEGKLPIAAQSEPGAPSVSQPGDPNEREADKAADQVAAGKPVAVGTITPSRGNEHRFAAHSISRQPAGTPKSELSDVPPTTAAGTGEKERKDIQRNPAGTAAAPAAPATPPGANAAGVSLASPRFTVPDALQNRFDQSGHAEIPVYLGKLAQGTIKVKKSGQDYNTPSLQGVRLTLPALAPLSRANVTPVLAVRVERGAISGYITIEGRKNAPAGNPQALMEAIKSHSREFGWAGIDVGKLPEVKSELKEGTLTFQVNNFPFKLGGFLDGNASFGIHNEQVTFSGTANVRVGGAADAAMNIERNEEGVLKGETEANLTLAKFSGKLNAKYVGGIVDIQGKVGYKTEKLSGEITLLVTDAKTADSVAETKLPPEKIIASAQAAQAPAPEDGAVKPGPRKLAGYGTLDFALTDWLTGKATVIVDGKGDITIIGKIAPPVEKELFAQKDYAKQLFKVEVRAPYGVPVIGNIYLFANIGLIAEARIGPAKLYNMELNGEYSTNPKIMKKLDIAASFNMSAYAGLKLRGEGGVGLEVLGHDVKAGVGANATAGVKGYVDARPTLGYREKADPKEGKKGEFFIKGHMELAAQPFLGLSGDVFVEVDSPWWSPLPDKKWTWPLGQLEYPLPGEFGLAADVDYVLGSQQLPEIKFSEAKFDKDKFMTDLMRENLPKKGKGEQEKPAKFEESGDAKAAPGKGGGKDAKSGGVQAGTGGVANQPEAKPSVQPGGGKKDKKAPTDQKSKDEGEKKKQELLNKGGAKPDAKDGKAKETEQKEHDKQIKSGIEALDKLTQQLNVDGATPDEMETGLKNIRSQYKVFKTLTATQDDSKGIWQYAYTASPPQIKGGPEIEEDEAAGPPWLDMLEVKPPKKLGSGFTQMKSGYRDAAGKKKVSGVGKSSKELLGVATYDWQTGEVILYVDSASKRGKKKRGKGAYKSWPIGKINQSILDSTLDKAFDKAIENSKGLNRDETWWQRQTAANFGILIEDVIREMVSQATGQVASLKQSGSEHGPDWLPAQLLLKGIDRNKSRKPPPDSQAQGQPAKGATGDTGEQPPDKVSAPNQLEFPF